jgi:hypothetical protein
MPSASQQEPYDDLEVTFESSPASGPPREPRRWPWIALAIAGAALAGYAVGVKTTTTAKPTTSVSPTPATAWDEEQQRLHGVGTQTGPETGDFSVLSDTTGKKCKGEGGCTVVLHIEIVYEGPPLSSGDDWEVTYQVTGGTGGPMAASFTLTPDQPAVVEQEMTIPDRDRQLGVAVVDVRRVR